MAGSTNTVGIVNDIVRQALQRGISPYHFTIITEHLQALMRSLPDESPENLLALTKSNVGKMRTGMSEIVAASVELFSRDSKKRRRRERKLGRDRLTEERRSCCTSR